MLQDKIQEIKNTVDIVEVIKKHGVDLQNKGSIYIGLCPFHSEKTPSFTVYPNKKHFVCFGCEASGDVINFIMRKEDKEFKEVMNDLSKNISTLNDGGYKNIIKADYEKKDGTGKWEFKTKEITKRELKTLGVFVKEEHCEQVNLKSVDWYQTPDGHRFKSNEKYPIFIFDYKDWQKIYQPLHYDKGKRFMFINKDKQPKNFIYNFDNIKEKVQNKATEKQEEENDANPINTKQYSEYLKENRVEIIKAAGDRDGLNLISLGYDPIWLDNEGLSFSNAQKNNMWDYYKKLYNLPDIDKSGLKYANEFALKDLNVYTIYLPEDLRQKYDNRGYVMKDFTDYVSLFKPNINKEKDWEEKKKICISSFKKLLEAAESLKFWFEDSKTQSYQICNTSLYLFLQANGFCKLKDLSEKAGFVWAKIEKNVIKYQTDYDIREFVHKYIKKRNLTSKEKNCIYKTNQLKSESLSNIDFANPDTVLYSGNYQCFVFRKNENNLPKVWTINKYGISEGFLNEDKFCYQDKINNFSPKKIEPFIRVSYSKKYQKLLTKLETEKNIDKKNEINKEIANFNPLEKFDVDIREHNFIYLKFLENASNFFWEEEPDCNKLTEDKEKSFKLYLLNKIHATGYLLHKYRDQSKPYCVYVLDGKNNELEVHQGGTGKSLFIKGLAKHHYNSLLNIEDVKGQDLKLLENKHVYENVTLETDILHIQDLHYKFDMHKFNTEIEGQIRVDVKHKKSFTIPYKDSPKLAITSNHSMDKFDGTLDRRTISVPFSDYYHSSGGDYKTEFTPKMDFGKNLFDDYNDDEWNQQYNFYANCLQIYFQFYNEKIAPPPEEWKERVVLRRLKSSMYDFCNDFFYKDKDAYKKELKDDIWEENGYHFIIEIWNDFKRNYYSGKKEIKEKEGCSWIKRSFAYYCKEKGIEINPLDISGVEKGKSINRCRKNDKDKNLQEVFIFRQPPKKTHAIADPHKIKDIIDEGEEKNDDSQINDKILDNEQNQEKPPF